MPNTDPDLASIRSRFPALAGDTVFLENAGGSQVPAVVADRMRTYMLETYVQLDAGYALSDASTRTVYMAHRFARLFVGAGKTGHAVIGHSCSALCRMLADAYAEILGPGDAIVLAEAGHEANVGPWTRLERLGVEVRWWRVDPETGDSTLDALAAVLDEKVRIVAFPHVSNLLGEVIDVEAVTTMAHDAGARVVVDGVAFAPHRAMDVQAWEVDYYTYSTYKVYGPHMGVLFGRHDAFDEIPDPNHFFVPKTQMPYRFELGGASHEGCAGLLGVGDYLGFLAGHDNLTRETVTEAGALWQQLEQPLQTRLLEWLTARPGVRVIGPAGDSNRVPTISFLTERAPSKAVAKAAHAAGFGIRNGHMYAYRLCEAMGIDLDDGVVRVSAVHYNTVDEIDRLCEVLDGVL